MTFIRYIAATDETPTGVMAFEYLRALLRIAPVRVMSMSGAINGKWEHYAALLATDIKGPFVNVVCCDPARWRWDHQFDMPRADGTIERVVESVCLYTSGVRNVLITDRAADEYAALPEGQRYEAIIVPTLALHDEWQAKLARDTDIVPIPVTNTPALRRVILP